MIVKFFTRGTGGSGGVFNYLLKDKNQENGLRLDAEVLRGDIDNQAMLIDSLDFKQKYTSGCLSFTESADQVTQAQKEQLMDGFEETIRAGLDVDRVSVSWIEHRDKGRLELNFVYANVDLEHGRAFQPYVHAVDKRRVNAWKDMQNIEYGFTDPNDPANKRLLGQRDNLPRDVKDARQAITEGLQMLIAEGVITSRNDVVQSLTDAGFEIARETDKAISVKNPNGKRNIRLTGGLYERDFKFSREVQATVGQASKNYRDGDRDRYEAARRLYESEIVRKRKYHQERHRKPKHDERANSRNADNRKIRYRYSPYNLFAETPSPFKPRFRYPSKANTGKDRGLLRKDRDADTGKRKQASQNHQNRNENMGNSGWYSSNHNLHARHTPRSGDDKQVLETNIHTATLTATADQLHTAKQQSEVTNGQATTRPSTESVRRATRNDTTAVADARRPRAVYSANATQERSGYSGIDSIIEQVSTIANTASRTLTDIARAVTDQNQRTDKHTKWLDKSSQKLLREHERLSIRVTDVMRQSNSVGEEHERVSECDSATREFKRQYGAVKGQIERFEETRDSTREVTDENNRLANGNTARIDGIRQINIQVKQAVKAQENQHQQRFPAPRMGR